MTFKIIISSAIVSVVITVLGNLITTRITQKSAEKIARETINHEIEKMERTWQREDIVSSDEEFAKMASTVATFVYCETGYGQEEALRELASVRSKESGSIGQLLDDLYVAVQKGQHHLADDLLSSTIQEKRRIKSGYSKES